MAKKDYAVEWGPYKALSFISKDEQKQLTQLLSKADSKQQRTVGVTLYVKPTHLPCFTFLLGQCLSPSCKHTHCSKWMSETESLSTSKSEYVKRCIVRVYGQCIKH